VLDWYGSLVTSMNTTVILILPIIGVILQIFALTKFKGWWKILSLLPALPLATTILLGLLAFVSDNGALLIMLFYIAPSIVMYFLCIYISYFIYLAVSQIGRSDNN